MQRIRIFFNHAHSRFFLNLLRRFCTSPCIFLNYIQKRMDVKGAAGGICTSNPFVLSFREVFIIQYYHSHIDLCFFLSMEGNIP
jgi:hypothetical protein